MNLRVHEQILRAALGNGQIMSERTLSLICRANKLSDLHQASPERHFDNAKNREIICQRWREGLRTYLDTAIERSAPGGREQVRPRDRRGALKAFGEASHALADFYAHTNWVELNIAQQQPARIAPLLGETCLDNDLPAELESGYFNLRYGLKGCPRIEGAYRPPQGYSYCHEQLAKDHPDRGHGAERIGSDGPTYHELAVDLAIAATRELWQCLYESIVSRYGAEGEIILGRLAWG